MAMQILQDSMPRASSPRPMNVLFASADREIALLIDAALTHDRHRVIIVASAADAWPMLERELFDLFMVDHQLPDGNSVEACRRARRNGVRVPIMLFTGARSAERHVHGLDAGADDSLAKPFAVAELRARVRAFGRRAGQSRIVHVRGGVVLDFPKRMASVVGREVPITMKEWEVLQALAALAGRVMPRARLLEQVWGASHATSGGSLEVLLTRIRKKLGKDVVRTLRTAGYSLGVV